MNIKGKYYAGTILLLSIGLTFQNAFGQVLPLKPERTISFTTTQGSWMNVDISPDGKTLAFNILGDLYTVPETGGKAKQITRGMALNTRPIWSPDGKKLAYISDYSGSYHINIFDLKTGIHFVIEPDTGPIDYHDNLIWAPDNIHIMDTSTKTWYTVLVGHNSSSSAISVLSQYKPIQDQTILRFSNKSRSYFYIYNKQTESHSSADGDYNTYAIHQYNYLKKSDIILGKNFVDAGKIKFNCNISPNARYWIYLRDSSEKRSLMVFDTYHRTTRTLVSSMFNVPLSYYENSTFHFAISPDSHFVYTGYQGKIHKIAIESGKDEIVPFAANVHVDMAKRNYHEFKIKDYFQAKYIRFVTPSPDGKKLAFTALNKLYVIDQPNGKPRILVDQTCNQFQPAWSPDGNWIAYIGWTDTAGANLWKAPVNGGEPVKLTFKSAELQHPVWSPDGKTIALISGRLKLMNIRRIGTGQIELVNAKGGVQRTLTDTIDLSNYLSFTKNGENIIYHNNSILVTLNLKTGEKSKLIDNFEAGDRTPPSLINISPDHRFIAYSWNQNMYLVPISNQTHITIGKGGIPAIRFASGMDFGWEKGGSILTWSYAGKFYRTGPDRIIMAAKGREPSPDGVIRLRVIPEHTIAINLNIPIAHNPGMVALVHPRIITMRGYKIIKDGVILIKNGRIIAVTNFNYLKIPKDAKTIDLTNKTVMPGLIDVHNHVAIHSDIIRQNPWQLQAPIAYGVTTILDPAMSEQQFGYAEAINAGKMIGPRFYTVGEPAGTYYTSDNFVGELQDAKYLVKQRKDMGGICIKRYFGANRTQRQYVMMACQENKLNMTNEGAYDPFAQLGMVKDGSTRIEHNPQWGDVYDDVLRLYAKSGTELTPVLQSAYGVEPARYYFEYKFWRQLPEKISRFIYSDSTVTDPDNAVVTTQLIQNTKPIDTINPGFLIPAKIDNRLFHLGAKLCLGGHGNDEGICSHDELWALHMGGISILDCLRIGTINGAKALGLQCDIGSIEVGKLADLLILNKNPLDDIHNTRDIKYVMKGGILYDGDNLDELWPVYKKCPDWRLKTDERKN